MDMESLRSGGATQADAVSQLSASRRDSDMTSKLKKARSLTFQLLREITDDFSEKRKIGQGTYGKVYVAKLEGADIAVKILHNNMPGNDDALFLREFENLMRLDHGNIVKLVGYCYETQHEPMQYFGRIIFTDKTYRALCFEYMENGSLQNHLSDEWNGLDWNTRYKIIKGAWEGLKHLHQGFEEPIYHLDLKPDNILLDNNMLPKLADFGMSKLFNDQHTMMTQSPIGTFGYLPIEFLHRKIVSNKLDIFSLGVVMIKIIGGPDAHSRSFEMGREEFLHLVHGNWRNRMQKTCHASRQLEAYCEQVNICTEIALTCMESDRHKRPNISDIIQQLNDTEAVIDKAFSWSSSSHSRMKGDLVKIRAFTGSEAIRDAEMRSDFPVLVQVTAPPWRFGEEMPRAGVNIVVVFDNRAWGYSVCRATEIVVDMLSSNDRLSFVWTEARPHRLTELTFMTYEGKANALALLKGKGGYHVFGDCTNIVAGLREGAEILRGREAKESDSHVGCIVLLSGDQLGTNVMIAAQEISREFPVHTFGIFDQHCPETLKYIADKTSATYSFCRQHDIKDTLALFMASILKVAATYIKITIRSHEGVAISSIESGGYRNNVSSDKLSGGIDIHDIYAGEQKNFIVYLTVAEGKKKLLSIGGQYRSLNEMSKQLPDTDVFVLRPCSGCSQARLAMHHDVAAELARIRLLKGLLALVAKGNRLNIMHMENLWDSVKLPKDGHSPPEETLSRLGRYVDEIKGAALSQNASPSKVPYLMSWLSCHQWQRATTKGLHYDSGAFTPAQPKDVSGSGIQRARIRRPRKNRYMAIAASRQKYVGNVDITV